MTKVQLHKQILSVIAPICKEHGYQYRSTPKLFMFYKIHDGVVSMVTFERKIAGFESGIYVMPLYMPNKNLVLLYGNQLWRINICFACRYSLECELPEEKIAEHLAYTKSYLQYTGFSLLDRFGTPQGVTESISPRIDPATFFFTNTKELHVAAAFSYFYCGNAKKGKTCYKKLLAILKDPIYGSVREDVMQVLEQLVADPSMAEVTLRQIQKETMKALQLPETGEHNLQLQKE